MECHRQECELQRGSDEMYHADGEDEVDDDDEIKCDKDEQQQPINTVYPRCLGNCTAKEMYDFRWKNDRHWRRDRD